VRGYSDFVPLGSQTIPLRGSANIMWTIKFRSGLTKRFKFPIRTTVEGTVDAYAGKPEPDFATIKKPGLFTKPARTE
jgi:adenylylsulfate reductase subunit B